MKEQNNSNISGFLNKKAFQIASLIWVLVLTAAFSAVVAVIAFFPARAQSAQTTQTFRPGRFALEMAEINIKMQIPHKENTQKMLFKVDTVTGEVWALQIAVRSFINPEILSAGWYKVRPAVGNAQTFPPWLPGSGNGF